jgi:transposase
MDLWSKWPKSFQETVHGRDLFSHMKRICSRLHVVQGPVGSGLRRALQRTRSSKRPEARANNSRQAERLILEYNSCYIAGLELVEKATAAVQAETAERVETARKLMGDFKSLGGVLKKLKKDTGSFIKHLNKACRSEPAELQAALCAEISDED